MEEVINDFESHRVDHKGMNVSRDERGIKTGFWGIPVFRIWTGEETP